MHNTRLIHITDNAILYTARLVLFEEFECLRHVAITGMEAQSMLRALYLIFSFA